MIRGRTISKYRVRTDALGKLERTMDGIVFDSKAELQRYAVLKQKQAAGAISGLQVHPIYPLHADGGKLVGFYEADFWYRDGDGAPVVEDVKGVRTELFRWKKAHFEAQYGMEITETIRPASQRRGRQTPRSRTPGRG